MWRRLFGRGPLDTDAVLLIVLLAGGTLSWLDHDTSWLLIGLAFWLGYVVRASYAEREEN